MGEFVDYWLVGQFEFLGIQFQYWMVIVVAIFVIGFTAAVASRPPR